MKKLTIIAGLFMFVVPTVADAGYYRNKNTFTGTYTSTGRTNNMGMKRAPAKCHTNSYGQVQRNNLYGL